MRIWDIKMFVEVVEVEKDVLKMRCLPDRRSVDTVFGWRDV